MNNITISGNVGNMKPLRKTTSGISVINFGLADDRGRDADGNDLPTNWFNVSCWNKLAETVSQYVVTGRHVTVFGRITEHRVWEGKDGWMPVVEVTASTIDFGPRPDADSSPGAAPSMHSSDAPAAPVKQAGIPF